MLWLIHAEPTPDPLKSVASQTGADVQKPAPLAITQQYKHARVFTLKLVVFTSLHA